MARKFGNVSHQIYVQQFRHPFAIRNTGTLVPSIEACKNSCQLRVQSMGKCSHGISKISKRLNFALVFSTWWDSRLQGTEVAFCAGKIISTESFLHVPIRSDQFVRLSKLKGYSQTIELESNLEQRSHGNRTEEGRWGETTRMSASCTAASTPYKCMLECDNRPVCWRPICSFEGLWPTPIQTRSPVFKWIVWTLTMASHFTTETGNFWNPETSHIRLCLSTSDTTSRQEVTTVASFPLVKLADASRRKCEEHGHHDWKKRITEAKRWVCAGNESPASRPAKLRQWSFSDIFDQSIAS